MKFVKKPVEVEAWQLSKENVEELADLSGSQIRFQPIAMKVSLSINTLEGLMIANEGDWVVKGTAGEFYPVKDHIFKNIYKKVEELKTLPEYFDEFAEALKKQIELDDIRWGSTWIDRGLMFENKTQEERFTNWVEQKLINWKFSRDKKFPWVKVAGEAMIGYVREKYMEKK